MRIPMLYRRSMITYFSRLAIVLGTVIALYLLSGLFGLITGASFSESFAGFGHNLIDTMAPLAFLWYGMYYLWVPYREFKIGMQNGQTRHQIWFSQLLGILSTTLFTFIFWLIAGGWHYHDLIGYLGTFLMMLDGISLAYAIGSGFALLSRKWKIIVGIAGPTIAIIILIQIIRLLVNFWHPSAATLQTLANLFNWGGAWALCGLLWLAIMLGCSYLFTMHQQLRRD